MFIDVTKKERNKIFKNKVPASLTAPEYPKLNIFDVVTKLLFTSTLKSKSTVVFVGNIMDAIIFAVKGKQEKRSFVLRTKYRNIVITLKPIFTWFFKNLTFGKLFLRYFVSI